MTGTDLRALRQLLGWSQGRLAEELGVSQSAVSRWENDDRTIPGPVQRLLERLDREQAA